MNIVDSVDTNEPISEGTNHTTSRISLVADYSKIALG